MLGSMLQESHDEVHHDLNHFGMQTPIVIYFAINSLLDLTSK